MAFEPFLAYELVDEKQATKLHAVMCNYRESVDDLVASDTADIWKAQNVLKAIEEVDKTHAEICDAIYRVPAIVHIAGERSEESNPDKPEQTAQIQRCSRCGSLLQFWYEGIMYMGLDGTVRDLKEEDHRWWDVGQTVAKSDTPGHLDLYEVKDRELERWEQECVDLSALEGMLDA